MNDFVIFTDSSCDLSLNLLKELDINFLGLICNHNNKEYIDDFGQSLSYKDFYNDLREGAFASTAQINAFRFTEAFEPFVKEGKSILYIAFSSALSGTYNSSLIAREDLLEKYPGADITIIDSKSASGGIGLLVYHAGLKKKDGKSKDQIVDWLNENILKTCHVFTVDSLEHLKRGGRISATAAAIGSLLSIKPVLHVNNNGELKNFAKAKGRKKAIKMLLEQLEKHITNPEDQTIFINHADCYEDAENLANMIREKFNVKDIIINYIGLAIGAHTGAGLMSLYFLGNTREP